MKKIYVGNFSFHMTEPELRALFEPFGTIESASVATDRDTGRSRGFGFVQMPNDDEAEKAMAALNGKDSGGRALTVNEARPQAPRSGFGGGGGRGNDRGAMIVAAHVSARTALVKPAIARRMRGTAEAFSNETSDEPLSAANADNGLQFAMNRVL